MLIKSGFLCYRNIDMLGYPSIEYARKKVVVMDTMDSSL